MKYLLMHRALGGAPVSCNSPLGLRQRRPRLAAAWAGGLLANAMRVRRSLVLQPGGGGCSISVLTDTLL